MSTSPRRSLTARRRTAGPRAVALLLAALVAAGAPTPQAAWADRAVGSAPVPAGIDLVDARTRTAIDRGMEYLIALQLPDGSWPSDSGKKVNDGYVLFPPIDTSRAVPHVGVTALAVLALLSGGHLPGRGPFGASMERGIDFLLEKVQDNGFITANGTRMYSHALAVLALAETYGATRNDRIRGKLERAAEFTAGSQNPTGGWRYVPLSPDSDMSVTVCQVVALRAAQNVGIRVPSRVIRRALQYVIESAVVIRGEPIGSFWYQPDDPERFNRDSFALCAAALTTIFQAGIYDDEALHAYAASHGLDPLRVPSLRRSIKYLNDQYIDTARDWPRHYYFFYGNYYAAQALYQMGGREPRLWAAWYARVRDDLLRHQIVKRHPETGRDVGWWVSNVDSTNAYATATALLILQFPLDHLPIHQR
ncbi:MAG: prenyltransferase/squalene oxidase repeat-containing protein [Planctomycetota bacterium]